MVHRSRYHPKKCSTRFASHTCCQVYPAQVHVCRTKPPLQYFPSLWSRESPQGTLDCTVSHARIWYSRKDLNLYLQSSADWCNLLYTTRVKIGPSVKYWRPNAQLIAYSGAPNYNIKSYTILYFHWQHEAHNYHLSKFGPPYGNRTRLISCVTSKRPPSNPTRDKLF